MSAAVKLQWASLVLSKVDNYIFFRLAVGVVGLSSHVYIGGVNDSFDSCSVLSKAFDIWNYSI